MGCEGWSDGGDSRDDRGKEGICVFVLVFYVWFVCLMIIV
jgi:hypothetical protein